MEETAQATRSGCGRSGRKKREGKSGSKSSQSAIYFGDGARGRWRSRVKTLGAAHALGENNDAQKEADENTRKSTQIELSP